MSFNQEKVINIKDFLEQLHDRLREKEDSSACIFFEVLLQNQLVAEIKKQEGLVPNWDGSANAGDFDVIYPIAANILFSAASSGFTEHINTYKPAHAVSVAFCELLNEIFECSGEHGFDLIPIRSFVDMAVDAGVVKVKDGVVSLTPEIEEIAQNMEREIEGPQN
ncbi:MAG: hypothetical protein AB1643_03030 [Patescibacteria group bacterium]